MSKFVPLMIAAAAMSTLAGCMAETQDVAEQGTTDQSAAACANPDGTNAMIAAVAVAIGSELHRWKIGTDFYIYRGYQNQEMLGLTATGLAQCSNGCRNTKALLAFQDSRSDQTVVFPGGVVLSAWSYAARLTTGFKNQLTCEQQPDNHQANNCPAEAHKLVQTSMVPGGCSMVATYNATTPAGGALAEPKQLQNKLLWAMNGGFAQGQLNPYIQFSSTGTTVTIDPTGGLNPPTPSPPAAGSCYDGCTMYSETNIATQCCTCNGKTLHYKASLVSADSYNCK